MISKTYIVIRLDANESRRYTFARFDDSYAPQRREIRARCRLLADMRKQKILLLHNDGDAIATFSPLPLPEKAGEP